VLDNNHSFIMSELGAVEYNRARKIN